VNDSMPGFSRYVKKEFKGFPLHDDLTVLAPGVIGIKRWDVRVDEEKRLYDKYSFRDYWLPANSLYPQPQCLLDRDEFVVAGIYLIDSYLKSSDSLKTRSLRVRWQFKAFVKFLEYIWINDIYSLKDVSRELTDELAIQLSEEGWINALGIKGRVADYYYDLLGEFGESHAREVVSGMRGENFRRSMSTNLESKEIGRGIRYLNEFAAWESESEGLREESSPKGEDTKFGNSMLRQTLGAINRLFHLPQGYGLPVYPYENVNDLARRLSGSSGRTKNISPATAAKLFTASFEIVYGVSEDILCLLSEVCDAVIDNHSEGRDVLGYNLKDLVASSKHAESIYKKTGIRLDNLDSVLELRGLRSCIQLLMCACFLIIAVCNARRRDEVEHRKFGLHRSCAKIINDELGIYFSVFYIEKSIQGYHGFYINKSTYKCIRILERMQNYYRRVDLALGRDVKPVPHLEQSLFSYRRLSRIEGVGKKNCWFSFSDVHRTYVKHFLRFALKGDQAPNISAHMFRRLYGLIFMYRHEIPELQALSYQYMHDSLSSTLIYVTDAHVKSDLESIGYLYGDASSRKEIHDQHISDIESDLREIGRERIEEIVSCVLAGVDSAGGFSKFLKVAYRRYQKSVEFKDLSLADGSEYISSKVVSRGHFPHPYRHSICMAGSVRSSNLANCSAKEKGVGIRPELASPSVCSGCPFQYMNRRHLDNLIHDYEIMGNELKSLLPGTVQYDNLHRDLVYLNEIIVGLKEEIGDGE
jgi:hypothetical protein